MLKISWMEHKKNDKALRTDEARNLLGKKARKRPKVMSLNWLLETSEGNIDYPQLKELVRKKTKWSHENENLPVTLARYNKSKNSINWFQLTLNNSMMQHNRRKYSRRCGTKKINNTTVSDQFAFKPTGSTTCALTFFMHHVTRLLEENSYVRCLMIDFRKSF